MFALPAFEAARDPSSARARPELDLGDPDIRSLPLAALALAIALGSRRAGDGSVRLDGACAVRPGAGDGQRRKPV